MKATSLFQSLTGDASADEGAEARNGLRHAASLSLTKIADGLIDPKLVLSWLLTGLGAPFYAGLLVPIREAGALLPQIVFAGWVGRMRYRKRAWAGGALGQGVAAALIALAALLLTGAAAGIAVCAALAVLAVARALSSVSYKDVLGKTIQVRRRGAVTGFAGSAASAAVILFAVLLISGVIKGELALIAAVALAAVLWIVGGLVFLTLEEEPSDPDTDGGGLHLSILKDNPVLRQFILVRGLLVSTALAPPYFVILGGGDDGQLGRLGVLVLASAVASLISSWIWGRTADRSSRKVMMAAGVLGAVAMLAAVALAWAGLAGTLWAMPATLFVLMLAYHGVRQGRSTYLVDIAPEDARAAWTAVANAAIGSLLLIAGAFGGALSFLGTQAVLLGFAAMSALAAVAAIWLEEAEAG
ncbi:MFS transporter [Chachezhania antarctica]|uniref:MFS transporter n=1 Tax=Chachezhania antarctica TaxID=2340860 RepID=UPI000EAC5AD5|nr:MFS transporter [Chachezhania antarctica]|tara:strand:+ start:7894 stop:9138 length:1245 start_codon:yes stop_codon:yes gene_type:complete